MADGDHQGIVRARQNRNPLIGNDLRRLVEPWVNDNDLGAALAALLHVPGVVTCLVRGPVAAKEHMQVTAQGLQVMRRVGYRQAAEHMSVYNGQCTKRNRSGLHVDRTTQGIQKHDVLIVIAVTNIGRSTAQDTLGTVCVQCLLDTGCHQVEGLVPVKALPFIATAKLAVRIVKREVLALHGVLDTRRRQNLAHLCASAQTRTTLRHRIRIFFGLI